MDLFDMKNTAPMLIAENRPAFDDPDWLYEVKFDGTRCIAYLDGESTVLRNKRNKDITPLFPELREIHRQVGRKCILDGEVFVMRDGRPDFFELQRRSLMGHDFKIQLASEKLPATFTAFDIIYLDGQELTGQPLLQRKDTLGEVVREETERMAVSRVVEGAGTALFQAAERQHLEGIVAKRRDSRYQLGKRTKDWVKCKVFQEGDYVVCGYYFKAEGFVSIILGQYQGELLRYCGHVVITANHADFPRITGVDSVIKSRHCELFPDFEGADWLEPELVCAVQFTEYTRTGGLRQPVYRGLRDDKSPPECKV